VINEWIGILTEPEETIAKAKAGASLGAGVVNYVIASAIVGLAMGLVFGLIGMLAAVPSGSGVSAALGATAIIEMPIMMIIFGVIGSFVSNFVLWVAAKIVGGTGSYTMQYYLISVLAVPLLVLYMAMYGILFGLILLGATGVFLAIVAVALIAGYASIIAITAFVTAMKESHALNTMKVGIAFGIFYAILMLVFVGIVFLIAGAAMVSQMPGTGLAGLLG
jgi:hypothetical protein